MTRPRPPIPQREIVDYLRLETDDATAELLLVGSPRYLGVHVDAAGPAHYWSYPTCHGVGWVSLDARDSLGTCNEVPRSVRDATPERAAHKMRQLTPTPAAAPVAKRDKPARAVWTPLTQLPACHYHPAWYEQTSFDAAARHYGAKVVKDDSAGPGGRLFYIQLTSGRYACIESRGGFPQTVVISLEVDTRRAGRNSGGKVHVRDIEEILRPMGGTFTMPTANLYIGWTTDD